MPVATISSEPTRFELESLEGAYVVLKRLSYGQWLHRQEMGLSLQLAGTGQNAKEMGGSVELATRKVTEWEFKNCIIEHNLEVAEGTPLNFSNGSALDHLDPKVGQEIANYIMSLHDFGGDLPK